MVKSRIIRLLVVGSAILAFGAPPLSSAVDLPLTVGAGVASRSFLGRPLAASPPAGSLDECVLDRNCQSTRFDVASGSETGAGQALRIAISWADAQSDLDLYICQTGFVSPRSCLATLVGSSAQRNTRQESVVVANPSPGHYRMVVANARGSSSYKASVVYDATTYASAAAAGEPTATSKDGDFSWASQAMPLSDYGEPSIDVDHAGGIYITAPGGAGVQMWKSFNGGKSFEHQEIASDAGGGDSEIEFTSTDVGFTADLEITDSAVSRTTDKFKTFEQQDVGIEQDRQWFAHKCDKDVFLVYHDFAVEGEFFNTSHDAGETWDNPPRPIVPNGGAPGGQDATILGDQGVNTFQGRMVVDQKTGDMYVVYAISSALGNVTTGTPPYGEPEQIVVATSHDGGDTWALHLVKGGGPGSLGGVIFPWLTLDKAGNVYVSYAGREAPEDPLNVFITYSTDHGDTFSKPYRVNTDATGHAHIYSTISGGDPGKVDIAWYTASTPDPASADNEWFVDFAQVTNANTQKPKVSQSRVYKDTIHHGEVCLEGLLCAQGGDRTLLDFFEIQVGADGMANIAFDNNGSPDDQRRVWYARQTKGPSIGSALHDTTYCSKGGGGGGGGGGSLPGPKVHLGSPDRTPKFGETVVLRTRLTHCGINKRTKIELRQKGRKKFVVVDKKRLSKKCKAVFKRRATFKKEVFQAIWPKQNSKYRQGHSRPLTVETH